MSFPFGSQLNFDVNTQAPNGVGVFVDTDPTALVFKYRPEGGSVTTLTYIVDAALVRRSAGNYRVALVLPTADKWYWQWIGTGVCAGSASGYIIIDDDPMS